MKTNNVVIMAWRDIWHPEAGGADIYAQKVAEYLSKSGFSVKYLTASYEGAKAKESRKGIEYIRVGGAMTIYILLPLYFIFKLRRNTSLLIENFNAVPFNIPLYFDRNITIIHHLQKDEWTLKYGKTLGNLLCRLFTNSLVRGYNKQKYIVTVSPSSKAELVENGFDARNIHIIYNGIMTRVKRVLNKDDNMVNILSLGRIEKTKHIDKAIKLIDYTVNRLHFKNITLRIAGKGHDEERLKSMVKKLKLEEHIKFLGYVSFSQKERELERAHLHVQFSKKEGWGITVIEAASKGTPTICYPVQGLRDSVKDYTGYFVKGGLKKYWEQVLDEIVSNDPNYLEKQRNCLGWANQFKWKTQMSRFIDLAKRALEQY